MEGFTLLLPENLYEIIFSHKNPKKVSDIYLKLFTYFQNQMLYNYKTIKITFEPCISSIW